jgi:hypothetical protein
MRRDGGWRTWSPAILLLLVREGAWSSILVLKSDDGDLGRRLYASGAWLLLNPKALEACLKEKT